MNKTPKSYNSAEKVVTKSVTGSSMPTICLHTIGKSYYSVTAKLLLFVTVFAYNTNDLQTSYLSYYFLRHTGSIGNIRPLFTCFKALLCSLQCSGAGMSQKVVTSVTSVTGAFFPLSGRLFFQLFSCIPLVVNEFIGISDILTAICPGADMPPGKRSIPRYQSGARSGMTGQAGTPTRWIPYPMVHCNALILINKLKGSNCSLIA
jgi:hypothetical protein